MAPTRTGTEVHTGTRTGTPSLIAFDVDGTLLTREQVPLASTMRAVAAARSRGSRIALASGRDASALRAIAERIGLDLDGLVLIGLNGSTIVDAATGTLLWSAPVPPPLLDRLVDHATGLPVTVSLPAGDRLVTDDADGYNLRVEAAANGQRLVVLDSLRGVDVPVHKVLFSGEPGTLAATAPRLAEPFLAELTFAFSAPIYFEATLAGVDKGAALRHYCELAGLDPAGTVAFGDHENDIGMLRTAGLGVAMGNAVPAALEAADVVTDDHESHGIAAVLRERFGL